MFALFGNDETPQLLTWLLHVGFVFNSDESAELQRKVRLMIGAAPEKNWISKDIAESLAMSEATFRRKLADEGQSFTEILVDVRMTLALILLQVTDVSISEIAYSSGSSQAPSMPVPRHYYQLELRPHDRIASTFHSGFESRPLLCPDWSSALLAFPGTPAPSMRRNESHGRPADWL